MATCFNRNTAQYKALLAEYKKPIRVESLILGWQKTTREDRLPTVSEAQSFLNNAKTAFSLKKRDYSEAILANLARRKLMSKHEGQYFINNTNQKTRLYDPALLKSNKEQIEALLNWWNVPEGSIIMTRTPKSYVVEFDTNIFNARDQIEEQINKNDTHILDIVQHLNEMFPQLQVGVVSVKEAEAYFNSLPESAKPKNKQGETIPFSSVKSMYFNGQAVLIKGRVTKETAVEEMLHPFVDAVFMENAPLFKSLLAESNKMFPVLKQQIDDAYSERRGFSQRERDLELVTQSLARHFNKQYEEQPTLKWYQKIIELLEFFADIIKDLFKTLTGKELVVGASMLKASNTLSSLARMLNTKDLQFELTGDSVVDRKIRFSLSPERKTLYDALLLESNGVQKEIITQLFHAATEKNKSIFNEFTAGSPLTNSNNPLVILRDENKEKGVTRAYINVEDPSQEFESVTTKIKGSKNDPENKYKINRDIGNDFDAIMEMVVLKKPLRDLPKMNVLSRQDVQRAIDQIQTALDYYRSMDTRPVLIPQVVIADGSSRVAGTIDLLAVHEDGTLSIIDLKVSKNNRNDTINSGGARIKRYDVMYPVNEGSIYYDPNKKERDWKNNETFNEEIHQYEMSTRAQHGAQVGLYRRILNNMGYTVNDDSMTLHWTVGVEGKDQNQKFTGELRYDGQQNHPGIANKTTVDAIVPVNEDTNFTERLEEMEKQAGLDDVGPKNEDRNDETLPETDEVDSQTYTSIFNTVIDYREKLVTRREALRLTRQKLKRSVSAKDYIDQIDNTVAMINLGIIEGRVDTAYETLVKDAITEIDKFIKYVENPANFGNAEYISRVLEFEKFAKTFRGLDKVDAVPKGELNLNQRQLKLKNELSTKLRLVTGIGDDAGKGIINNAVENYIRQYVTDKSNRDFTKEELDQLLTMVDDIGMIEFQTGDLATNRDTLLQLIDKLYKNTARRRDDIIEYRNDAIRKIGTRLENLSPGGKVDFSPMLVFDKDGNFTGKYVEKIGEQYNIREREALDAMRDSDGEMLQYIYKDNVEDYTPADIAHNKKVREGREKYARFAQAERKEGNKVVDGDFHRYTNEFKKIREKYEEWFPIGKFGYWQKKRGVTDEAHQRFRVKYYTTRKINKANLVDGVFNGTVQNTSTIEVVKSKYVEKREVSSERSGSIDMRSAKYVKLMNPNPNDSLAITMKEFYLMFVDMFENELLQKLPSNIRNSMLGRVPVVMDHVTRTAKNKGSLVTSLWAKAKSTKESFLDFFRTTSDVKKVLVDENGDFVDSLPIYYVGAPRTDEALKNIDDQISQALIDYNNKNMSELEYTNLVASLRGKRQRLLAKPTLNQISTDMVDSLMRFSMMAENYEVMGSIEDTLKAFTRVVENRSYNPAGNTKIVANVKGKLQQVGMGKQNSGDALMVRRLRKWMRMIYWDNDKRTRNFFDKVSDGLIGISSLTYVGFNTFGNINNYAIGRINNGIEAFGGRYFDGKAYLRAEKEFNMNVVPDMINVAGSSSTYAGFTGGKGKYKTLIPARKYQALVAYFRMMDSKADIREQNQAKGKKTRFSEFLDWAYLLQDGAEYNVQTKVGIAILMSKRIRNSKTGEELSLYDAFQYNRTTGELTLKEGFDQYVNNKPGTEATIDSPTTEFTDDIRYEIRNYIREVNKQIHGNYAREDRTVMQAHWLGNLAMQFHKWVAPAFKARYRSMYFDENLGYVEGRYRSAMSFLSFLAKEQYKISTALTDFKNFHGEKGLTKLTGLYRTVAELSFLLTSFATAAILESLFDDDDDDKSRTAKRFENALIYQFNRQGRELQFFLPVFGFEELFMLVKSPIASTRTLGELGQAIEQSLWHPFAVLRDYTSEEYDITADKDYYYQRTSRKGQAKLAKEWADVIPFWYTVNRWIAYDTQKDFFIK